MSAAEWVRQEDARRRGIVPSSNRQMPSVTSAAVQRVPMEPTEQQLRVGQQMVRNMDEQYGKRMEEAKRMEESKARQMQMLPPPMQPTRMLPPPTRMLPPPMLPTPMQPMPMQSSSDAVAGIRGGIERNLRIQEEGRLRNAFRESPDSEPVKLQRFSEGQRERDRARAERHAYEAQQAEETHKRETQEWRDQVEHKRARERARQAAQPTQSRPSDQFLGNFTHGDKEYGQFAVQQPDGRNRVALAVRDKEPFKLY